jgi:hypothetical protein
VWQKILLDGQIQPILISEKISYYSIPFPDSFKGDLLLTECHCSKYLDRRSKFNNIRENIEQTIVDTILYCAKQIKKTYFLKSDHDDYYAYDDYYNYYDYYPITLINIGNDQISILVILAKLYLQNHHKVQVINLDLDKELELLDYDTEQPYNNAKDDAFTDFIGTLFPEVAYHKIYYKPHDLNNTNMRTIINKIAIPASKVIIFAEDLGQIVDIAQQNYSASSNPPSCPRLTAKDYDNQIFIPAINNILTFLDRYIDIEQQVAIINYDGKMITDLKKFRDAKQSLPLSAKVCPKL